MVSDIFAAAGEKFLLIGDLHVNSPEFAIACEESGADAVLLHLNQDAHSGARFGGWEIEEQSIKDTFSVLKIPAGISIGANTELLSLKGTTLICPANPVTSISPIILLSGVEKSLKNSKCIAVTPFLGGEPFSGPAGILMKSLGKESSSSALALLYSSFLNVLIVDKRESSDETNKIKNLGIECIPMNTKITDRKSQVDFWTQLKDIL